MHVGSRLVSVLFLKNPLCQFRFMSICDVICRRILYGIIRQNATVKAKKQEKQAANSTDPSKTTKRRKTQIFKLDTIFDRKKRGTKYLSQKNVFISVMSKYLLGRAQYLPQWERAPGDGIFSRNPSSSIREAYRGTPRVENADRNKKHKNEENRRFSTLIQLI